MGSYTGFVDNTTQYANREFLAFLEATLTTEGWTINDYDTSGAEHYLLVSAPGYTGPDGAVEVFLGFRSYQDVGADYYNLSVAGMTGYVSGNAFAAQPGFREAGVCGHNARIDYWVTVNDRRIAFALKVGTPVYESAYAGLALPYATPRQFPYPLVVCGTLSGVPATRFSDTTHAMGFNGNRANLALRFTSGSYLQPYTYPWANALFINSNGIRPTDTYYPLPRVVLHDNSANVYGELDGIYFITGFDNAVENTLSIGGDTYVVFQDVYRTGFGNYFAMRMDP